VENEKIQIVKNVDAGITKLSLDPNRIEQAITSLISNAIEFTPQGGQVTVSAKIAGQSAIHLSVSDSGIGMSDKQVGAVVNASKERLVAAWHDGEDRQQADLYQIRSIAEEHGGKFNLKSTQLEGTEVIIELPDKSGIAEMHAAPKETPDSGPYLNNTQVPTAGSADLRSIPKPESSNASINAQRRIRARPS
jgi:signal transduction histidine kinase